jgi:hypothetical protein
MIGPAERCATQDVLVIGPMNLRFFANGEHQQALLGAYARRPNELDWAKPERLRLDPVAYDQLRQ